MNFSHIKTPWRVLGMAVQAIWAYRLRSVFVSLAVGLGIAALALIVAAVDGAQRKAVEIVEWFGPDAAFILGGDIKTRSVGQRNLTLTWRDAQRLRQSLPGAYQVVPMRSKSNVTVVVGAKNMEVAVLVGATEDYASVWNWPLAEGRDISLHDVDSAAKICLLGDAVSKELFGQASPLGQTVFINNTPMRVVGVLTYRGMGGGGGPPIDERIILPLTTLTQRFNMDRKYFRALRMKFLDAERMEEHVANLRAMIRDLHHLEEGQDDDFTILTAAEILKFMSMLKGSLVAFLGVTAGVAVLTGGFVLANLFYLSVAERRREIGLKKALGAKNRDITLQFLAEAVLLTLFGAALGVLGGVGLGKALSSLGVLDVVISPKILLLSFAAAGIIGLVFGLRPARQAARLDPIQALRGG
jgi:putative ABC transport system permease protein